MGQRDDPGMASPSVSSPAKHALAKARGREPRLPEPKAASDHHPVSRCRPQGAAAVVAAVASPLMMIVPRARFQTECEANGILALLAGVRR